MAIEPILWIYWSFCAIATLLVMAGRSWIGPCLSPQLTTAQAKQGYLATVLLAWSATLITAGTYVLFTVKQIPGDYRFIDLMTFSALNGILEQFMFIFWFLIGCAVGQRLFSNSPIRTFICGYVSYVIYSGLIHPLFWFQVLPQHEPFMPMILILPLMSATWMWLLWRYRAIAAIVAMHIAIDFLTVGHLHFPWFEALQL